MIEQGHSSRSLIAFVLLASLQTVSQAQSILNQATSETESFTTGQVEQTTETDVKRVTWDPADPANGTDGHARDHFHDHDHYEKAHGHARDHLEQTVTADHPHRDEEDHDGMHHTPWAITQPGYDLRHRPDLKEPTVIHVYLYHDFIEYVNEADGEIMIKLFVVAYWTDRRMRQLGDVLHGITGLMDQGKLPLPGEMKNRIWVPDLYMPMAREVRVPTIHQPAESITLMANGTLKYSSFFVISFKCQMHYHDYPMDVQQCNLDFLSYKYSSKDVQFRWHPDGLDGKKQMDSKHFHVQVIRPKGNSSFVLQNPDGGTRDVLRITYVMRRHLTFHLLQTYLPSVMLVFIGWLSLLVPLDFAYGRMVLSVTTLLVLVSFFVTTSQTTPGANEVKALDIWLFSCIFFVFSAIVDCIVDLRFLSMVEKESQIAGEEGGEGDGPPVVDERLRRASRAAEHRAAPTPLETDASYSVQFYGDNTPFQADKEVLIATPAVLRWLRLAVLLERGMTVVYPALFALFTAVYWAVYITAPSSLPVPEAEH